VLLHKFFFVVPAFYLSKLRHGRHLCCNYTQYSILHYVPLIPNYMTISDTGLVYKLILH
jgi:hypothetical protein